MNKIELEEMLDNALDWIWEHCQDTETYFKVLKDIGMTEAEIEKERRILEKWA